MNSKIRCNWETKNKLYIDYHDKEWGTPTYNDDKLFEYLILEGMQAGLSWLTILKKRENYRLAYDGFNPLKVANYDEGKKLELLNNAGLVRNKLKIEASITNAKAFLNIQKEFGSFKKYIWEFVDSTIIYAHMQATGMVNDHVVDCFRYKEVANLATIEK